ncbi:polyprenyl synthetase family protein [Effusibacillus lacus]|uniref:Farnesyl diphosphate synthase n=1 Tax=Effusibacillus lacus TaxID=1348429 RepID=A0A292YLV2_9BACL|nr:farnesyl diphosphate synthase [Effusibacillus lacus]TCS72517.1 farnesyl-diphosphate synthase [Effusibacillus lacus]GAX90918.1 farnesyl-diphosphate synthase [Effusibacillus lacus]
MSFQLESYLRNRTAQVADALNRLVPAAAHPPVPICEAMRYSLFAGGKRIRPILTLATVETLDGDWTSALPIACAIEMIHTYSLIHDDLPAMDNDDFRRGKPTNHKVYGDAMAILAGDALLTHAFQVLSETDMPGREKDLLAIIREIAMASGVSGMIGGQVADIQAEGKPTDEETLLFIHRHKTGDLLTASVRVGAIFAGASERELLLLTKYAESLGLAFQIKDDILDVTGDQEKTGKTVGADAALGKMTFPAVYGLEESKKQLAGLTDDALDALTQLNRETIILRSIADYLLNRES